MKVKSACVSAAKELTRTYIYRKHEKPLVEKRRRERINHCLVQLRDLVIQTQGQAPSSDLKKLEKAEILELTVRQLRMLRSVQDDSQQRRLAAYKAGYLACMQEVRKTLSHTALEQPTVQHLQSTLSSDVNSNFMFPHTDAQKTLAPSPFSAKSRTVCGAPSLPYPGTKQGHVYCPERLRHQVHVRIPQTCTATLNVATMPVPTEGLVPVSPVLPPNGLLVKQEPVHKSSPRDVQQPMKDIVRPPYTDGEEDGVWRPW